MFFYAVNIVYCAYSFTVNRNVLCTLMIHTVQLTAPLSGIPQ